MLIQPICDWLRLHCCAPPLLLGLLCLPSMWLHAAEQIEEPLGPDAQSVKLATEFVEKYAQHATLEAQIELARRDRASLDAGRFGLNTFTGYERLAEPDQRLLAAVLSSNVQALTSSLGQFAREQQESTKLLQSDWIKVRAERNRSEIEIAEVEANKRAAGKLAALVSLDNRWFWLSGLIAIAALATVSWHERRHEYRRRLNGAKARAMGIASLLRYLLAALVLITGVIFLFGNTLYGYLSSVGEGEGTRSLATIQRETERMAQEIQELQKELEATVAAGNSIPADTGATQPNEVKQLSQQWQQARSEVRTAQVALAVNQRLAGKFREDVDKLEQLRTERQQNVQEIAGYKLFKMWIRAGIGLGLIGLSTFGAILLMRGVRRRRAEIANTCPLCLGVGTLEQDSHASGAGRHSVELLKCTNILSDDPYEECDFKFMAVYRDMPKLCFPTLGHPGSGKTHWLAMTYRELNQGNYQSQVQFDKVRSESSEDFDRIVDEIINSRMNPQATMTHRIPHPVLFNFRDHDRYGKSNVLVSIFDYSGEVIKSMTLHDTQRRRALDADGYLFFLDPTTQSEEQVKELINFREDVRVIRKVRSGTAIRAPVALCVSKIDLLISESYADPGGTGAIGQFYKELAEIDPTGEALSLEVIEARSELIRQLRDTIWPGWQIERQIDDLFGGRCKFFPLTPVGLTDLGETDLRNRQIEPFGILEPLMWLLHMNGYPVLD